MCVCVCWELENRKKFWIILVFCIVSSIFVAQSTMCRSRYHLKAYILYTCSVHKNSRYYNTVGKCNTEKWFVLSEWCYTHLLPFTLDNDRMTRMETNNEREKREEKLEKTAQKGKIPPKSRLDKNNSDFKWAHSIHSCWRKMMTKSREHLISLSMLYTRFNLDVILAKVMHTEHIHNSGERCELKPDQNVCNV